eukprot:TRINITY_DN21148_c0_g1_i1.p1 TRINITY_DN21148_c0_g1~~TRINITY_DN21148_c0_g1_i1.p1  ORF type:complete len:216 (-),score=39.79 TRINITY_DN21148_c0_g1_i1:32-679(-)
MEADLSSSKETELVLLQNREESLSILSVLQTKLQGLNEALDNLSPLGRVYFEKLAFLATSEGMLDVPKEEPSQTEECEKPEEPSNDEPKSYPINTHLSESASNDSPASFTNQEEFVQQRRNTMEVVPEAEEIVSTEEPKSQDQDDQDGSTWHPVAALTSEPIDLGGHEDSQPDSSSASSTGLPLSFSGVNKMLDVWLANAVASPSWHNSTLKNDS